jgi:hypothetical protein
MPLTLDTKSESSRRSSTSCVIFSPVLIVTSGVFEPGAKVSMFVGPSSTTTIVPLLPLQSWRCKRPLGIHALTAPLVQLMRG